MNRIKKAANFIEKSMNIIFTFCGFLAVAFVILITGFLLTSGMPAIGEIGVIDFIFGTHWKPNSNEFGIFPMIVASIYVTAGAIVIGVPIGLLTAIYLAMYCPSKIYKVIKPLINLLASVPSIVYGFFCLVVVVPVIQSITHTSGKGILTTSILLGIMILPTIINTAESSIRAVPPMYYEGALALGATKERSIMKTVVPAAKSGIMSGVILAVGRAIGETMAVVMVAGNQAVMPNSITSGVRTLTSNIVMEMGYATGLHREALIGTAVVLFVFVLIINICFSLVTRKKDS